MSVSTVVARRQHQGMSSRLSDEQSPLRTPLTDCRACKAVTAAGNIAHARWNCVVIRSALREPDTRFLNLPCLSCGQVGWNGSALVTIITSHTVGFSFTPVRDTSCLC